MSRFEPPPVLILALASIVTLGMLCALPGEARADAFYICKKKGLPQAWINAASLKSYKRKGYSCHKRMEFQDRSARPGENGAASGRPASPGQHATASTVLKRFSGPAGERHTYEAFIMEASERFRVPANLIRAVIRVESNFRPNATSSAGAQGLMQLMPGTARQMGVADPFDPRQNILGGSRYLRLLINQFAGDPKLTIAAYHAGPGIVSSRGAIPYKQTERYVRTVLTHFLKYREAKL